MNATTPDQIWKVGQLAEQTGLTVRTLHHYDHIGLVRASGRTASGHRLYGEADVQRLYQVLALRQLGLSLETAAEVLAGHASMTEVLAAHQSYLDQQLAAMRRLRAHVATLTSIAGEGPRASVEDFLELIRTVITMDETVKQYFDETQLTGLAERRAQVGEQAVADVEAGWRELLPRVAAAVQAGMDPAAPPAQEMAAQWMTLLEAFHGGDEALRAGLYRMQAENAERIEHEHGGPTAAQLEFIQQANAAFTEVEDWIAHHRDDDGELIGFLAPAGRAFTAMTVFGSPLAEPADRLQAESVLDSCGLSYLADRWRLRLDDGRSIEVEIVEASPERAVVKNVDFASGLDHGHRMALTAPVGDRLLRGQ